MKSTALIAATLVLLAGSVQAQTAILVRHAEKVDASADPHLSPAGEARARALSVALAEAGVTHVISTPLHRTRETGGPTAEAAALSIQAVETAGSNHPGRVAAAVRDLPPEAVVLVVGHSNTVPAIATALGVGDVEPLKDCEYDRMLVITLDGERASTIRARYGEPSEPC